MESIGQDLYGWWLDAFTDTERDWMVATYAPLTIGINASGAAQVVERSPFVTHLLRLTAEDAFYRLSGLATWFSKPDGATIAIRVAVKALEFADRSFPILDRHFGLQSQCTVMYRWRDTVEGALDAAITTCIASIEIHQQAAAEAREFFGHVPAHHCFRQLRIIEEKRGNFDRAIELCEMAKDGGWADDWDKDIARLRRKKEKAA